VVGWKHAFYHSDLRNTVFLSFGRYFAANTTRMAGHSKWANIKHRKAAQDKKRAKIWTRIIKEITIAARDAGGDVDTNPALRLSIQNAKGSNMPKDTMDRAVKKGLGGEGADLQPLVYEGYAANGVAVVIETMTDNPNRTVANIRLIFSKTGGSLGTNGSLSFIFSQKGVFTISMEALKGMQQDDFELSIIEGGAEELDWNETFVEVVTSFEDFGLMQRTLDDLNVEIESADLQRLPNNTVSLNLEDALTTLQTVERFEDNEDVTNVYHNLELTSDLMEALNNS
jgi:YebC/PmpR family DNA-binding regulatory protein